MGLFEKDAPFQQFQAFDISLELSGEKFYSISQEYVVSFKTTSPWWNSGPVGTINWSFLANAPKLMELHLHLDYDAEYNPERTWDPTFFLPKYLRMYLLLHQLVGLFSSWPFCSHLLQMLVYREQRIDNTHADTRVDLWGWLAPRVGHCGPLCRPRSLVRPCCVGTDTPEFLPDSVRCWGHTRSHGHCTCTWKERFHWQFICNRLERKCANLYLTSHPKAFESNQSSQHGKKAASHSADGSCCSLLPAGLWTWSPLENSSNWMEYIGEKDLVWVGWHDKLRHR